MSETASPFTQDFEEAAAPLAEGPDDLGVSSSPRAVAQENDGLDGPLRLPWETFSSGPACPCRGRAKDRAADRK